MVQSSPRPLAWKLDELGVGLQVAQGIEGLVKVLEVRTEAQERRGGITVHPDLEHEALGGILALLVGDVGPRRVRFNLEN